MPRAITTLFLDVGGVLLSNAWGPVARQRAARQFGLDCDELNRRRQQTFNLYEEGRLDLQEYLGATVFHQDRPFTRLEFQAFMWAQSQPFPDMLELVRNLKATHGLRVVAISNEGWELACHRIETFALRTFVDDFLFSCFVGRRKPDPDIYRLALNITQTPADAVVYIEENPMFVAEGQHLGIQGICHSATRFTRKNLAALGLYTARGGKRSEPEA